MLVLSRRQNEEIVIGDGISIKIIGVYGGRVKLGIEAPKSVRVVRAEIAPPAAGAVPEFSDRGGAPEAPPALPVMCDKPHDSGRPAHGVREYRPSQCP